MQLTRELFTAVTSSITVSAAADDASTDSLAQDGRTNQRVRASTQVQMYGWDEPLGQPSVRIRDLSPGGLGIFQADRITLDQQVVVRLPASTDSGSDSILMLCAVIYWEPLAANLYAIGLQFRSQISQADLDRRQQELAAEQTSTETEAESAGVLARISHAFARARRAAS